MERTGPEHPPLLGQNSSPLSIMIVAGEASGDKHGASLVRALTQLNPAIKYEFFGSGGEEMRGSGVETLVDAREVGIIGLPEIARAIGKLYRAYRTLLRCARSRRPVAVVLIDWPDFNMRLAKTLHRQGFKIIYYISPQVWAWRRYRIRALRRDVDRMLVILPFEEEFYKRAGLEVRYVGHPLAEAVRTTASREEFCRRHGLDPMRPIFALLPGSRHKEIHYHLPVMLQAAGKLRSIPFRIANCGLRINSQSVEAQFATVQSAIANSQSEIRNPQFVVPLASTVRPEDVAPAIREAQLAVGEITDSEPDRLCVIAIEDDTYNALAHSDFAVVASGTATVEAALAGTPMVIIYRGSELNWRLIRPLIHLDTFGMVNLIAGRRIVPELMQRKATGENIAREAAAILSDPARLAQMREDLKHVREQLKADGGSAAERAAQAVIEVIRQP
jgi:lipid-A-disaccharide synthase